MLSLQIQKQGYTQESFAETAGVTVDQVKRLCNPHWGYKIQRDAIKKIAVALKLEPTDFIDPDEWLPKSKLRQQPKKSEGIDWNEVCLRMLNWQQKQKRLRQQATEQGFEVNVFVPLGLVERKQQQRRSGNVALEQVYQLDQEVITKIYEHDDFLKNVIGQAPSSQNQHIAIVGEPGAGKSTWLDKIATYIRDKTNTLPIYISLANLQGKTLKDYILQEWLPEALSLVYSEVEVEPEVIASFKKRLRQGGTWLLLDGVDEMSTSGHLPLYSIQSQLTDWLNRVRVVLTCRLNVWDSQLKNPLSGFDTYKTQEFQLEQIDDFIQQWFTSAEVPEQGKTLRTRLEEPKYARIRELVKNPLRLSLLCQVVYADKNAELPDTKAGLYERFTRYFYEWKPCQSIPDLVNRIDLQEKLHQALGRLAIAGLDSSDRFRLRQSVVYQGMKDELLIKSAWELGWLNLVDRDAEADEPVYAFFHPTFQEYFAALAIDDWHFFFNHTFYDPTQGNYRIFQTYWKNVFLLYMGRENIAAEDKEKFLNTLIDFNDGLEGIYKYKAEFLVVSGILEFKSYSKADTTIRRTVSWALNKESQLQEFAKEVLKESDLSRVTDILSQLLKTKNSKEKYEISKLLGEICPGNTESIATLKALLNDINADSVQRVMYASSLTKIDPENSEVINFLIKMIHTEKNNDYWDISVNTASNGRFLNLVIPTLLSISALEEVYKRDEFEDFLIQIILKAKDQYIFDRAVISLKNFNPKLAKDFLKLELENVRDEERELRILALLGGIEPNNQEIIHVILDKLDSENEDIKIGALESLGCISITMKEPLSSHGIVPRLITLLENETWGFHRAKIADCLGEIANSQSSVKEVLINLLEEDEDQYARLSAAIALKKIDFNNSKATDFLIDLIPLYKTSDYDLGSIFHALQATVCLSERLKIIKSLRNYLTKNVFENTPKLYKRCFSILMYFAEEINYLDFREAWYGTKQ